MAVEARTPDIWFYNLSFVVVWAWITLEVMRRSQRFARPMGRALASWYVLGLLLVAARFGAGFGASGHAMWMWFLVAVAWRLDLPRPALALSVALVVMVVGFKLWYDRTGSLVLGTAIGLPPAAVVLALAPWRDGAASGENGRG